MNLDQSQGGVAPLRLGRGNMSRCNKTYILCEWPEEDSNAQLARRFDLAGLPAKRRPEQTGSDFFRAVLGAALFSLTMLLPISLAF